MNEYIYNREFESMITLLEIPSRNPERTFRVSLLKEKDRYPVWELRIFFEGKRTLLGVVLSEKTVRILNDFLNDYFHELDEPTQLQEQLGYDPFDQSE